MNWLIFLVDFFCKEVAVFSISHLFDFVPDGAVASDHDEEGCDDDGTNHIGEQVSVLPPLIHQTPANQY